MSVSRADRTSGLWIELIFKIYKNIKFSNNIIINYVAAQIYKLSTTTTYS